MFVCICSDICIYVCMYVCVNPYMHCVSAIMLTSKYRCNITVDMFSIIEIQDDVITTTTGGHSYLIKKLIGSGAFANIYLAIDIHSGDKKALKVSE